jgi:hypothetical protein
MRSDFVDWIEVFSINTRNRISCETNEDEEDEEEEEEEEGEEEDLRSCNSSLGRGIGCG